jgi:tetratricopeptide (TPR) repeat protein
VHHDRPTFRQRAADRRRDGLARVRRGGRGRRRRRRRRRNALQGGRDPQYSAGVAAIKAQNYAEGIRLVEAYISKDPSNADDADAQNWLGFANRKSGNLDAAFMRYDKALAIDPKHRGAHEYLGEAYLMVGNLGRPRSTCASSTACAGCRASSTRC